MSRSLRSDQILLLFGKEGENKELKDLNEGKTALDSCNDHSV